MSGDPEGVASRPRGQSVVVAGASAGGVEALVRLVGTLPPDFPCAVLVVLHVVPSGTSVLPAILARAGQVPVQSPLDGEPLREGHVYVAPPNRHLVVESSRVRLSRAPRENGHRPAVDATMRTAASAYGGRAIGIVLSGSGDDGTAGLMATKAGGGAAIVQDPEEALYEAMPRNALAHVDVDAVLPIAEMAPWILRHVEARWPAKGDATTDRHHDVGLPRQAGSGEGTRFTCPDCGGVLFERHDGPLARFQYSVGHVFSIESLSDAQSGTLESALWAAVRSLEDRAALLVRMSDRARSAGRARSAQSFAAKAQDARARAHTSREAIESVHDDPAAAAEG